MSTKRTKKMSWPGTTGAPAGNTAPLESRACFARARGTGLMVMPDSSPIAENVRDRFLTPEQVRDLIKLARKSGRYGKRNATAILIAWQHGLRVSELCGLRWTDIDWRRGTLAVRRLKGSAPAIHYLTGEATRALRMLRDDSSQWVFSSSTAPGTEGRDLPLISVSTHFDLLYPQWFFDGWGNQERFLIQYLGNKSSSTTDSKMSRNLPRLDLVDSRHDSSGWLDGLGAVSSYVLW